MTALGYFTTAAFAYLLYRQIRSGSWLIVPSFTALCGLIVINGLTWSKWNHDQYFLMQPPILALQVCSVLEMMILAFQEARGMSRPECRGISVLLLGVGVMAGAIGSWMFPILETPMQVYRLVRFTTHCGLAIAGLTGLMAVWLRPIKLTAREMAHGCLLVAYLLKFVTLEAIRGRDQSAGASYDWLALASMSWSFLCAAAWLRWGVIVNPTNPAIRKNTLYRTNTA